MNAEGQEVREVKPVMGALRGKQYEKVNGSANCGDAIGLALAGADRDALLAFARSVGIDIDKYSHLNAGQQRMNVGNRLRGLVKKGEVNVDALAALPRAPEPVKAAPKAAPAVDDPDTDEDDDEIEEDDDR